MTTVETLVEDLTEHMLTKEKLESFEMKNMIQFETEKFMELVDSQNSFTCINPKTQAFRHYELISHPDLEYYTKIAMCFFNDGAQVNTIMLGYYNGDWVPILTYVSELSMYDLLLYLQHELINRCFDWLHQFWGDEDFDIDLDNDIEIEIDKPVKKKKRKNKKKTKNDEHTE